MRLHIFLNVFDGKWIFMDTCGKYIHAKLYLLRAYGIWDNFNAIAERNYCSLILLNIKISWYLAI